MTPLMALEIDVSRKALAADITSKLPRNLPSAQNFKVGTAFAVVRMIDVDMSVAIFVAHEAEWR
ncbi:unnamed protein product [Fusarium graminearum]|nr:unnamed protein product [Fusarium graminearum]